MFGGRSANDLNDLLVFTPQDQQLTLLSTAPSNGSTSIALKPRRKPAATRIGSCIVVFGGFDGNYFNDLNFVDTFDSTLQIAAPKIATTLASLVNEPELSDIKFVFENTLL